LESRSVYLGIAVRLRGSQAGALSRAYLHSGITEGLWYAVAEAEQLFGARLAHGVMLASLYGNPRADLDAGNDTVYDMYVHALHAMPYVKVQPRRSAESDAALIEEWRRVNAEEAQRKAAAASGEDGEEGGNG